jgi:hypothetical protein
MIAEKALSASGINIPVQDVTISIAGEVLESVEVA